MSLKDKPGNWDKGIPRGMGLSTQIMSSLENHIRDNISKGQERDIFVESHNMSGVTCIGRVTIG